MIGYLDQLWTRLEVRHLLALEVIVRVGSFRAAARELGYSQSAVSEQVKALEAIVGQQVLERSRGARQVVPTPAGRLLLEHAERVGETLVSARAELAALQAQREVLRVGIFASASARLLPSIVRTLRADRPELELLLHEAADPADLIDLVVRGDLDVAFASERQAPDTLDSAHLLEDPFVLLVAADGPLADLVSVTSGEIARQPLVDYRSVRPELLPTRLLPRGVRPNVVFRSDDQSTVSALVAAGIGSAIVPLLAVPVDSRLRAIPIDPPLPPRSITLRWLAPRSPTPALLAFVAAARAAAGEVSAEAPSTP